MVGRFRACFAAALLGVAVSAAGVGRLELVTSPVIVLSTDTPAGSGAIVVRNSGDAPVKAALVAGTFFTEAGNEPVAIDAKIANPQEPVGAGETVTIPIELANVTEPGAAKAELSGGGTKLGELRVVKKVFAFNVAPVGYEGKEPFPVHLVYGKPGTLTLMNDDAVTHSFVWSLRENDRELAKGQVPILRPHATVDLTIPAESAGPLRWLEGTLQAPASAARLILRAVPRGATGGDEYWLAKEVPVQLRRTAGDGVDRDLWQIVWILGLLLAGGITSLYLTYWVPNTLKKVNVQARIEELTPKIHQLRRTSVTLRVLLGVQRNQLRERLKSRNVLSLDFLPLAAECEQRANALHRRIELAQKIEGLLMDIEREWESGALLGPTLLNRAATLLRNAIAQLEQGELPDEKMRELEAQVEEAAQHLRPPVEDAQLKQEIVKRAEVLQERKEDLQPAAKEVAALAPALVATTVEKLVWPRDLWILDYAVTKMEVAERVPAALRGSVLELLRLHALTAFHEAKRESRQLREGIVPEMLMEALKQKKVRIELHPEQPQANALVSFDLVLLDPKLSSAIAKQTLTCRWDFGDGLHEDGWRVSHYFRKPEKGASQPTHEYRVCAIVTDRLGESIAVDAVPVTVTRYRDELVWERTRIEWIRLGVALFVVLLGLLAGAKEQLAKLDFVTALVALFLLGVTADQIKNLLAPRTP
jgi:hypothetical protein